jgi:regulatory protein
VGGDPLESARRLLARRDHGRAELRAKLASRGFEAGEVAVALKRLEEDGLLDDSRCARALLEREMERGHGLAFVRAKARARRLSLSEEPGDLEREAESLRKYLRRKGQAPKSLTGAVERAKLLRSLRGRGYTQAAIAAVLGPLADNEDGD